LVAPPRVQFLLELRELSRRAQRAVQRQLHEAKAKAELLRERLPEPSQDIAAARTELRDLAARLERGTQDRLQEQRGELRDLSQRLAAVHPRAALSAKRAALSAETARLQAAYHARLLRERDKRKAQHALLESVSERLFSAQEAHQTRAFERLGRLADTLHALSPLAVLSRGYALATRERRPLRRARDLRPGDTFDLRLAEGSLLCRVLSTNENET
jgi:exodeoxyribonuclease VII large subunit